MNKIKVEGFVRQSIPAFNANTCYFVACKNRMYYLITIKMDAKTYSELPLDILFKEKNERQRNNSLCFNKKGYLEFRCQSGFYLLDLDGKVSECSRYRSDFSVDNSDYGIKIVDTSQDTHHFQDDEWQSATTYFKDAIILKQDEEVLKIKFNHLDFEDVSIYGVIDENIILKCYARAEYFYLICNIEKKVINACYCNSKPIFENYSIVTESWKKGNVYEDCDDICFSFDKKSIVYWGIDGQLKCQPLSDVNYVLEKGKAPTKYSEILCMENHLRVYKSGWDDGDYHYKICVKNADEWKRGLFKINESYDFRIDSRESAYALKGHKVWILLSEYLYENVMIEFDVDRITDFSTVDIF